MSAPPRAFVPPGRWDNPPRLDRKDTLRDSELPFQGINCSDVIALLAVRPGRQVARPAIPPLPEGSGFSRRNL